MRITYRDTRFILDRTALKACLLEQGWEEDDIDILNIYIKQGCPRTDEDDVDLLGLFNGKSVFVYYEDDHSPEDLDNTLLHECRHHWQKREEDREFLIRLEAAKGKRAEEKLFFSWKSCVEREKHITYLERPSEIDARAFAERLISQWSFFSVRLSEPALEPKKELAPVQRGSVEVPTTSSSAVPAAFFFPSSTRKYSAIVGAALTVAGLGYLLFKPWWHREGIHA